MRSDRHLSYAVATAAAAAFFSHVPSASAVPLGNLFDDPAGTNLFDAVATDTYGAQADTGDLGVEVAQLGGLEIPVAIAPGVFFDFANAGGNFQSFSPILNDAAYTNGTSFGSIRTTNVPDSNFYDGQKVEDGIGMHANAFVTFDLNDLRAAGGTDFGQFTGEGGINDDGAAGVARAIVLVSDATSVLAGYINGQQVDVGESGGVYSFTGTVPGELVGTQTAQFTVPLNSSAAYLTLVTTSGADHGSDQTVFSEPQLSLVPEPTSLALLALGAGLLRRRRA